MPKRIHPEILANSNLTNFSADLVVCARRILSDTIQAESENFCIFTSFSSDLDDNQRDKFRTEKFHGGKRMLFQEFLKRTKHTNDRNTPMPLKFHNI